MIKLLSLFSGIGAFETALRRGGHEYQLIGYCEIDKYAANAYSQIHGVSENYNLVDVTKVNTVLMDDVDLITYGFPCQDISAAGKQRGFEDKDGNRTRSGLFFEALRIIEETRPLYAIAENVKALTSKKFEKEFKTVLDSLNDAGYNNYWAVLNAKDYGIPQNRERVFIVSIRKDVDDGGFKFPEKMPLNIRVKDILESNVDEKFYINTDKAKELIKKFVEKNQINEIDQNPKIQWCGSYNGHQSGNVVYERGICNCIDVAGHVEPQKIMIKKDSVKQIGNIVTTGNFKNPQRGRIYDSEGISPCLNTMQGGGLEPKFIEPHVNKIVRAGTIGKHETDEVLSVCGISKTLKATDYKNPVKIMVEPPVICASRGRNTDNPSDRTAGIPTEQRLEPNTDGVSNTLTTVQKDNYVFDSYRIRKLTPLECFRLMGFSDEEFNRIRGVSNTQLYKMAGNSIVVDVVERIFNNLLRIATCEWYCSKKKGCKFEPLTKKNKENHKK